jgi:DNA repair exonuclease SbcCD ATPase subunit
MQDEKKAIKKEIEETEERIKRLKREIIECEEALRRRHYVKKYAVCPYCGQKINEDVIWEDIAYFRSALREKYQKVDELLTKLIQLLERLRELGEDIPTLDSKVLYAMIW